MILEQRPEVLHSSTMDYVGETTLLLPFEIKDGFSQRLIIDGSNATGTNSVTKVEVLNDKMMLQKRFVWHGLCCQKVQYSQFKTFFIPEQHIPAFPFTWMPGKFSRIILLQG